MAFDSNVATRPSNLIGSSRISNPIDIWKSKNSLFIQDKTKQQLIMTLKVYMTNIPGSQLIAGNQRKLKHILETNKIEHIDIDVSDVKQRDEKEFLQQALANAKIKMSLPQIFNGNTYCCDFDGIMEAVESNGLKEVLKLVDN